MSRCIIGSVLCAFSVQVVALILFFGAHGTWTLFPFFLVGHRNGTDPFTYGPISGEEEILGGVALLSLPYVAATMVSAYCSRATSYARLATGILLSLLGTFLVQVLVQISMNNLRTPANEAVVVRIYYGEFTDVFLPQALVLLTGTLLLRYLLRYRLQRPDAAE